MGIIGGFLGRALYGEYESKKNRDFLSEYDAFNIGNGEVLALTNLEKMRSFISYVENWDTLSKIPITGPVIKENSSLNFRVCKDVPLNSIHYTSPYMFFYSVHLQDKRMPMIRHYSISKSVGNIDRVDKTGYLKHLDIMESRIKELYEGVSPVCKKEIEEHIKLMLKAIEAAKSFA